MTVDNHEFNWVVSMVTDAVQMWSPYLNKLIQLLIAHVSVDDTSFSFLLCSKNITEGTIFEKHWQSACVLLLFKKEKKDLEEAAAFLI